MYDLATSFLTNIDEQTAVVLGTAAGGFILAIVGGLLGIKRGKPGTTSEVAAAIAEISCGAPLLMDELREIARQNRDALDRQAAMQTEIGDLRVQIGILLGRSDR